MTVELVPADAPDAVHYTCCRTDDPGDVALCGLDVSGQDWGEQADDERMCAPCSHLEHTGYCPVRLVCSLDGEVDQ